MVTFTMHAYTYDEELNYLWLVYEVSHTSYPFTGKGDGRAMRGEDKLVKRTRPARRGREEEQRELSSMYVGRHEE